VPAQAEVARQLPRLTERKEGLAVEKEQGRRRYVEPF
jgi:hypothetical protein